MLSVRYRVGGGTTGNVPAGHLVRTATAEVVVHQPYAADGGAQTESLTAAQARAIEWLERRFRAVNLDDFEALALETPGVPVARARALAGYFPTLPCVTAAGCVTVVVVPRCPSPRPEPTAEFLEAVRRWLEPRVALTTELHVIGPCFQSVAVHARLHPDGSVPSDALLEAAGFEVIERHSQHRRRDCSAWAERWRPPCSCTIWPRCSNTSACPERHPPFSDNLS